MCIFWYLRIFVPTFLSLQSMWKKTSVRGSKRPNPPNPLNLKTLLMFLNTDVVRRAVLGILPTAPNFCHVHFCCFQSSPVANIFSLSFACQKKAPVSALTKFAYYYHALSIRKHLSSIKTWLIALKEFFSAGWYFIKQCYWIVSGPQKSYRLSTPHSSCVLPKSCLLDDQGSY